MRTFVAEDFSAYVGNLSNEELSNEESIASQKLGIFKAESSRRKGAIRSVVLENYRTMALVMKSDKSLSFYDERGFYVTITKDREVILSETPKAEAKYSSKPKEKKVSAPKVAKPLDANVISI
jgi:hypothetical protein